MPRKHSAEYRHERVSTPGALRRRGLTKYRSTVTPTGHVLRIAYPPGRRQRGAGELQAILHPKGNPTETDIQAARQFMAVLKHRNDKRYLKQVFGYVPAPAEIDAWAARLQSGATLRDALYMMHKYRHPKGKNPRQNYADNPAILHPKPPVKGAVLIYHRALEVAGSKSGIPHQCDAECKKSGHRFLHKFSKACSIWGLPDGQVLIE